MKALITKPLAEALVLNKYANEFRLRLVGSVAHSSGSYNDMDIVLLYIDENDKSNFCTALENDGWAMVNAKYGDSPRYRRFSKIVGGYEVILDLYVQQFTIDPVFA